MRFRYLLLLIALAPTTSLAWDVGCKFKADRAGGIEAGGVEKVVIRAGAGDMKVVGRGNAVRIEARGTACAAKQELLDTTQISVRREGNVVYVETTLPQSEDDDKWGNNDYAYIDIGIALPTSIPVEALDSSGDATFEDLKALNLQDSSGDLTINRIAGMTDVSDSSGDIEIEVAGSVRLQDSSGDIDVEDVHGDVDVAIDSSGDIEIAQVDGSVRVAQDSPGSIRAEHVKGSVTVDSDSSGDIYAGFVGGDFTVNSDSSGSIDHESITGKVTVPKNKED
jgi:DUF4097 and DUF4098 domain-containing protein YvlB